MGLTIHCRDVGVECDFVVEGKTEEELFRKAGEHAKEAHGLTEIPEDRKRTMRRLIREDKAA